MKEKFTSGEWITDGEHVIDSKGRAICAMGESLALYCNSEANAHLIAASPKMYREIEREIEWLERLAKKYVIGSYELQGIQSRIERKRKLLAEARGEI